jgi:hypothetical protein
MSGEEIDSILSGVIILLLIIVVWKWYKGSSTCGQSSMSLSCGCNNGQCKCRGMSRVSIPRHKCRGGRQCPCGSPIGRCNCGPQCMCQKRRSNPSKNTEGMKNYCSQSSNLQKVGTPGYQPMIVSDDGNYSGDTVQKMALEPEVLKSQQDYIDGFGFSGMATGSSHETTLEETGRSYGTSDFVGLTQRKWCKARQLATPASDARTVPTETIKEWCNIDMEELI